MRLISPIALGVLLVACGQRGDPNQVPKPAPTTPTTGTTTTTTTTSITDTGTPTGTPTGTVTGYDCAFPPAGPRPWSWLDIQMEEDFDFDEDGYALVQEGSLVVGRDITGTQKIVSATVSWDASGIQVLSTGEIVVGAQDEGAIKLVDAATGGWQVLMGGMTQPNGLEVESTDRIYVSEMTTNGRVRWYDMATGLTGVVIDNLYNPNGVVLSPDEQTLYIGGHTSGGANGAILAVDRLGPDLWDAANMRVIFESPGGDFDGVEVDICGNIYTVEYNTGRVTRVSPDGAVVEELVDIDDPAAGWGEEFNSIRWGNGVGGWDPMTLYVTNRVHLFPVEIGIPGKPSPSSLWAPTTP